MRLTRWIVIGLALIGSTRALWAQTWVADPAFRPELINDVPAQSAPTLAPAPDGRWLVTGSFTHLGAERSRAPGIAYLHRDGTVDHSFQAPNPLSIWSALPLADGSVLIVALEGGGWEMEPDAVVKRLKPDGTLDATFPSTSRPGILNLTPLPDGSIAARHYSTLWAHRAPVDVLRLKPEGTLDSGFTADLPSGTTAVLAVAGQPDGTLLVSVSGGDASTSRPWGTVIRLTPSGSIDPSFNVVKGQTIYRELAVAPDGKVLVKADNRLVRLRADGSLDPDFRGPVGYVGWETPIVVRPDGSIVTSLDNGIAVLAADGTVQTRVPAGAEEGAVLILAAVTPDGIMTVARDSAHAEWRAVLFATNGEERQTTPLGLRSRGSGQIQSMATDSESRLVVVGDFTEVNGQPRSRAVRFTPGGQVDPSFLLALDAVPGDIVLTGPAGSFLLGMYDQRADGTYGPAFRRILADGTIDRTFNPPGVWGWHAMTADGRVLVSRLLPDATRPEHVQLVWLAADGSVDRVLPTRFGGFPPYYSPLSQSPLEFARPLDNGQYLVGGRFSDVNAQRRPWVARLNADGSLDPDYGRDLPEIASAFVHAPDRANRVVIKGVTAAGTRTSVRLRPDGTLDRQFFSIPAWPDTAQFRQENGLPDLYFPWAYDPIEAPDGTRWAKGYPPTRFTPVDVVTARTLPERQLCPAGGDVTFYTVIGTRQPAAYQWLHNGRELPGATAPVLTLAGVKASDAGTYQTRVAVHGETVMTAPVMLTVSGGKGRLVNVSSLATASTTRGPVVGFVVGPDGAPRPWLVRAMSAGLRKFGVAPTLALTDLTLFGPAGHLARDIGSATREDMLSATARVGAFPPFFAPYGDMFPTLYAADSALLLTLPSGAYTARAHAQSEGTGTVLVEVYDTEAGGASGGLINASVRLSVEAAAGPRNLGFALNGPRPTQLLIRGVGPGLGAFGVSAPLADPVLMVFGADGVKLAENHGWADAVSLAELAQRTGAFALQRGSRDTAVSLQLEPGTYTVEVQSQSGIAGEALIEIYIIDP